MSKLSGGVLILAGIAVGAYALWPHHRTGTEIAAAQNAGRAAAHAATDDDADRAEPARVAARPQPAAARAPAAPAARALTPPPPAAAPPPPVTAVTLEEAPPRVPVGKAGSAAVPLGGADLTREIQVQLKRIGCDPGAADGVWGPATRRATQAFTARVNASLPVEGPDPVLLAMLQSHEPGTCGACPPGQDRTADGRCLPAALMAHAGGNAGTHKEAHSGTQAASPSRTAKRHRAAPPKAAARRPPATAAYRPMRGRMGLAGPPARRSVRTPRSVQHRRAIRHRQVRARARSRAAEARARQRRAAHRRSSSAPTGLPAWLPFILP